MVVRIACCLFLLLGMRTQLAFATAYSCPSSVETPDNEATVLGRGYSISTKSLPSSIDEFLETFRNLTYDDWLKPYDEMKAGMYDFKKKYFAPNLNDGDSIYESACGIGLNLFLTLEILNEISGLESLVVYGSDVVKESVQYANSLFENAPPFRTEKGTICEGDSANLHFVPSNSFDFVYTGFISPILDVLDLGHSFDKNREHLVELCGSRDNDWKARKLSEIAQQRQNDWFAKWVTELVRIAKPGKSIAVEQVSSPFCDDLRDQGGVAKDWWRSAVKEYHWDVDPDSIVFEDDIIYPHFIRYHVYMRKNPASCAN